MIQEADFDSFSTSILASPSCFWTALRRNQSLMAFAITSVEANSSFQQAIFWEKNAHQKSGVSFSSLTIWWNRTFTFQAMRNKLSMWINTLNNHLPRRIQLGPVATPNSRRTVARIHADDRGTRLLRKTIRRSPHVLELSSRAHPGGVGCVPGSTEGHCECGKYVSRD